MSHLGECFAEEDVIQMRKIHMVEMRTFLLRITRGTVNDTDIENCEVFKSQNSETDDPDKITVTKQAKVFTNANLVDDNQHTVEHTTQSVSHAEFVKGRSDAERVKQIEVVNKMNLNEETAYTSKTTTKVVSHDVIIESQTYTKKTLNHEENYDNIDDEQNISSTPQNIKSVENSLVFDNKLENVDGDSDEDSMTDYMTGGAEIDGDICMIKLMLCSAMAVMLI